MFVETMSSVELLNEYLADKAEIREFDNRIDTSTFVGNLLRKHRKDNKVSFTKMFSTSRGNRYIGVFIYEKDIQDGNSVRWSWQAYSVGLLNTPKGVSAISFYEDFNIAMVFQAHFFKRYKERFLKVCDWKVKVQLMQAKTQEDVISIYIRRNVTSTFMDNKIQYNDLKHIFAPTNDGVALIQFDGQLFQANTFITKDMLSKHQKDLVDISDVHKSFMNVLAALQEEFPEFIQKQQQKINGNE